MRLGERTPVAENGQDGVVRVLGMARELLGCTGGMVRRTLPTTYWTFAYETCAGVKCTMTAKGNDGTPVEGAKVILVLSGDGTGEVTWIGL